MGVIFEVSVWARSDVGGYFWKNVYSGDDREVMEMAMKEAEKTKYGAIQLIWRPKD